MPEFIAERDHDLHGVFLWYRRQLDRLNEEDRLLPGMLTGESAADKYFGATLDELRALFARDRLHLRNAALLLLLTETEALLRIQFAELCQRKRKPKLYTEFRRVMRERGDRLRLIEDILDTWTATAPQTAKSIREFKGVIPLRDWLAHGRYWNPKLGRRAYTVDDVYDIAAGMLAQLSATH